MDKARIVIFEIFLFDESQEDRTPSDHLNPQAKTDATSTRAKVNHQHELQAGLAF